MTTTDTMTARPEPGSTTRRLRRGRTDRVAAGVAGGLGEYFNVDPVLFRVLFATSAFFGGAGILAYLLAWAAIPESGTERAPIDGWIAGLRARRFPVWLVAVVAGLILWAAGFSWWVPWPTFPVVVAVVLLIVFFTRRDLNQSRAADPAPGPEASGPDGPTVSLSKDDPTATTPSPSVATAPGQPTWVRDAQLWLSEARAAARERRRRSLPIRLGVLAALAVSLTCLAIADAIGGVQLQWYFWTVLIVLAAGVVAAAVTRRWSWSLLPFLVPTLIGAVAFAGSDASLHDGVGQRDWKPVSVTSASYRLAFGQGVLDLRDLQASGPTHLKVTLGAGEVKVILPRTANVTVHAHVHAGQLRIENVWPHHSGFEFDRTIDPPAGATGAPVSVDVHLTDGDLAIDRR